MTFHEIIITLIVNILMSLPSFSKMRPAVRNSQRSPNLKDLMAYRNFQVDTEENVGGQVREKSARSSYKQVPVRNFRLLSEDEINQSVADDPLDASADDGVYLETEQDRPSSAARSLSPSDYVRLMKKPTDLEIETAAEVFMRLSFQSNDEKEKLRLFKAVVIASTKRSTRRD